jgi:4'-phosphopantetheinyl transferase
MVLRGKSPAPGLSEPADVWLDARHRVAGAAATIEALAPGEVHVWWARLGQDCGIDVEALLDAEERSRRARFRHAADRDLFGLAHALKRLALARYAAWPPAEWRFVAGQRGKPALAPDLAEATGLNFSLSHSEGLAAVAVGRAVRVGVDVEPVDRPIDPDELARDVLAPAEIADLAVLTGPARSRAFMVLWTLKEAYVKALGLGLSHPLKSCSFSIAETGGCVTADLGPPGAQRWGFEHRLLDERDALSVAYEITHHDSRVQFRGAWREI